MSCTAPRRTSIDASAEGALSSEQPQVEEHVGFLLRLAYQRASANLTEAIGSSGITPMQFQTLRHLQEHGQMTQNQLGRSVGMPPANIHHTVRRLLAQGLVAVGPSAGDRRVALVQLTQLGEDALTSMIPAADAANALTLSALPPDQRAALIDGLRKLAGGPPPPVSA